MLNSSYAMMKTGWTMSGCLLFESEFAKGLLEADKETETETEHETKSADQQL